MPAVVCFRPTEPDIAEIRYFTGIDFPLSARLVYSEFTECPRAFLDAKIYISRADLTEFMNAFESLTGEWRQGVPSRRTKFEQIGVWEEYDRAWHAYGDAPRRSRDSPRQPLVTVEVIVTVRDTDTATVYISAAGH